MKTNVNLFIALILCAVIGGALYFLARPSQESLGWNPDEMYGDLSRSAYDGSAFTNATFSGSSNAGGFALSMQGGSLSSRTRAKSSRPITIQYPIANSPSPIANTQYPIANGQSPIAYMTSGAEYRSFGGGGNGNMGAAGTFRANTQSPITNSQSPISNLSSPIAYNPSPISNIQLPIANHPSPIANIQYPIANSEASMFGYELKTTFGTASYDDMYGTASNRRINGAMRLPGSGGSPNGDNWDNSNGFGDTWLIWLREYLKSDEGGSLGNGDVCGLDYYELEDLYELWCDEWSKANMGKNPPSFWNFFDWFYNNAQANGGSLNLGWINSENGEDQWMTVNWVPVGDAWPLFVLALAYLVYAYIRRRKLQSAE